MIEALETQSQTSEASKRPRHIGVVRFSAAQFLVALILFFISAPFLAEIKHGRIVESALLTILLLSGVLAVGRRRRNFVIAGVLVAPAIAGRWLNHYRPDLISNAVFLSFGLLFAVFVVVKLLEYVLRARRVTAEVLCAAISDYLLLGLVWSFAYVLVAQTIPHSFAFNNVPADGDAFTPFDAFYFSFVTLSTVGYGDISPVSHGARTLAVFEAMTGTLYIAVLISRLVALYSAHNSEPENANPRFDS